jgi:hypothetical protein
LAGSGGKKLLTISKSEQIGTPAWHLRPTVVTTTEMAVGANTAATPGIDPIVLRRSIY